MIRITQLVHGSGTVSEAIKHRKTQPHQVPSNLLAFTEIRRPLVFWNVTNRCNLSCAHCYINAAPSAQWSNELTLDEAKAFIDDLAEIKTPLLMFSGGEPLVRNDIWKLLDHARSRGLKTALSSNGTLITKNVAKKIKDLEVEYVGISLDGANEKIHDAIRNQPGSFRKSVRALKNCVEAGLKCGIRMTITKDNYHEVSRLLSLAIRLGVPRFCIYWLVPSGRGRQLYSSKRLGNEEVTKVLDLLYMKAKEFNSSCLEILTVDAPQDGVYILNKLMEESSPEYKNALKLLEYMGDACSAGERIANVDSAGNVYPCQFAQLEELKIGNIRQRKFSEIWSDSENPMLSAFRNKTAHLKGKCSLCAYKELCKGGCRIRAYIEYGDIWAEDPLCANS